jgi:UDP-N-acetylmuramoyl-L-alanyl-D-glutamate--2,6-diaminopimelate ligase
VIGSLGARYGSFSDSGTGLTTPAPPEMHRCLRHLAQEGARTVIVEVTSHALRMDRVRGLTFSGGLIGAILPGEHIDSHRSYDDYVAAKRASESPVWMGRSPTPIIAAHSWRRRPACAVGWCLVREPSGGDLRLDVVLDRSGHASGSKEDQSAPWGHPSPERALGRGYVRNAALAVACALLSGFTTTRTREVLATIRPLHIMERYEVDGRHVLDDTGATPTASVRRSGRPAIPARSIMVLYALRGSRGADINRRNRPSLTSRSSASAARS